MERGIPDTWTVALDTLPDSNLKRLIHAVMQMRQQGARRQYVAKLQEDEEPAIEEDVQGVVTLHAGTTAGSARFWAGRFSLYNGRLDSEFEVRFIASHTLKEYLTMQRRTFLKTTGAASLAALCSRSAWALPADNQYLKTIGLQLYTLRNQLAQNIPNTLKAVADAGYYQVELMGVADADQMIAAAHDVGLHVTSAMFDWQTIVDPDQAGVPSFSAVLEAAVKHNLRFLVIPYVGKGHRETADQLKALAERANRAGEKCRQAKIQLCYHDHAFEFKKLPSGETGWEVYVKEFDPELVKFEIDVFWAKIGGMDPRGPSRA